jgi:hypothetical protein
VLSSIYGLGKIKTIPKRIVLILPLFYCSVKSKRPNYLITGKFFKKRKARPGGRAFARGD